MEKDIFTLEKILVVTKSIPLQQELRAALSNYRVVCVETAEQAIDKLRVSKDFSALLVGIYLPETRGFHLLDYLKGNPDLYKGPVLIITDAVNDKVIDDVKHYDVFDYVIRYSNEHLIRTTVRNAVIYYAEKKKLLTYAVEQVYQNLNDTKALIALLAQIVEFNNTESGKHVENVGTITRILCKKLMQKFPDKYKLSERDIEYISLASALHDIGKVYIPDHILNKPSKLDEQEREIMQTHTTLGAGIISRMYQFKDRPVIKFAYDICLSHHERWDGTGYPKGLKGEEIPIWAQAVSIADCYDALTSDRVYRRALVHGAALSAIEQGDCGIFNPDLLECLWECSDEIEAAKNKGMFTKITKESICSIVEDICKIK